MGGNAPCKDMTSNVDLIQISVSEVYLFKLNSKFSNAAKIFQLFARFVGVIVNK